ncbi:MAG: hypothetical protein JWP25_2029 [Bradyrhizobium sp.]|nr:hypothetical protein [Bradyrhizobium sp.]
MQKRSAAADSLSGSSPLRFRPKGGAKPQLAACEVDVLVLDDNELPRHVTTRGPITSHAAMDKVLRSVPGNACPKNQPGPGKTECPHAARSTTLWSYREPM